MPFSPSPIMVWQKGQPVATTEAPVFTSWSVRRLLTRSVPCCSSIHICAPPAPQQRPFSRLHSASTSSTPRMRFSTSRGASYTPL